MRLGRLGRFRDVASCEVKDVASCEVGEVREV